MSAERDRAFARYRALVTLRERAPHLLTDEEREECGDLEAEYDWYDGDVLLSPDGERIMLPPEAQAVAAARPPPEQIPPLPPEARGAAAAPVPASIPPLPPEAAAQPGASGGPPPLPVTAASKETEPDDPARRVVLIPWEQDANGVVPFTEAQLDLAAKVQRTTRYGLKKRWLIMYGERFYVIGAEGMYRIPSISKSNLVASLPRDLVRVPSVVAGTTCPDGYIEWTKRVGENAVPKTPDDFVKDYCTVARESVASLSIQHSYYDPKTEIFWERVCPLRNIQPRYDERIDHWLRLLGRDRVERLLDWIASITRLDRPTCALYLNGPKDVGKSLLALGLSRLWSETGYTSMESVYGNFNSALTSNPLIFADERLPEKITSGWLREFIAADTHPLRRKNIPDANIKGCFRVIIAANNQDLLRFEKEDFSPEDVDAIGDRFLEMKCGEEPAEYIRANNGREMTDGWVEGDGIAAHALWLRDNRKVASRERFLVSGVGGDEINRKIATGGDFRGKVIGWICKAMLRDKWGTDHTPYPGIVVGGGRIYVNTGFVNETWKDVLGLTQDPPSPKKIGQALKPLTVPAGAAGSITRKQSLGKSAYTRAPFYSIDPKYILDAVEEYQIGTVDGFRALINRPRAYPELVPPSPDAPPPVGEDKGETALTDLQFNSGRGLFDDVPGFGADKKE